MPVVQLPDGTLVQLPDSPEEQPLVPPEAVGFAKQKGMDLLRGAGMSLETLLKALPPVQAQLAFQKQMGVPTPSGTATERAIPRDPDQTKNEKRMTAVMEAAGGGLLSPYTPASLAIAGEVSVPAVVRSLLRTAGSSSKMALAGAGSELAGQATEDFLSSQNPKVQQIAGLLARVGAGAALGYGLGPRKQTTPEQDVERDTGLLTRIAQERVSRTGASPANVANDAERAASQFLMNMRNQRTNLFEGIIDGETVRPYTLSNIARGLRSLAAAPNVRPEEAAALREMASSFRDSRGNYYTDLGQLSLALKSRKDNPPPMSAATSTTIPAVDMGRAFNIAQEATGHEYPALTRANRVYRYFTNTQLNPVQEGAIGKIADRNLTNSPAYPTAASRLEAIINDQSPADIHQTMLQLQQGGGNLREIARALMDRKLNQGGLRPGERVFGAEGSGREAQMGAVLESAGLDPRRVSAPLRAADLAETTLPPKDAMREYFSVGPHGIAIRGIFNILGQKSLPEKQARQAMNRLMAQASPEELQQLTQLSMFDNDLRKALTAFQMAQGLQRSEGN